MRAAATLVVGTLAVVALAGGALQQPPVAPDQSVPAAATVDIKVSVKNDKGCGPFFDSLPALVSATDFEPGAVTPTTVVCLRNQGGAKATASMTVIELATRDDQCTADEPQVDATCGNGAAGELQDVLVQEYVLLVKCNDPVGAMSSAAFGGLVGSPLMIGPIGRNDTRCVALRLRYAGGATAAAQTDSLSWRYAFQLTG